DEQNGVFVRDNSIDLSYEFFKNGFDELSQYANIYTSDKVKNIKIKDNIGMSMGVKIENDLLAIDINTEDFPIEELSGILQSYREHKKYYRMKNGSFVNLDVSGLNELSMFLDNLNVKPKDLESGQIKTSKYRSLTLDQTLQNASNIKVERDHNFKKIVSDVRNVKDSLFQVPSTLKSTLRNYQKEGYRWLKTMSYYGFGGILADDMGIGKTLQVITLLEDHRLAQSGSPSIVICPSSLILNWYNEVQKFAPQIKVGVVHGQSEQRAAIIGNASEYDVLITSYDYLKRDIACYEPVHFHYQIIDEAQYIKNQSTKNAMTVKEINATNRFALTGTPIENSLAEIWSIFDFLMPGYLYTYPYFKKHFEIGIVKYEDEQSLESLRKMVEPFILRRVKKDVLKELPDKIETTLFLEMDETSDTLYKANILSMKEELIKQQASGNENKILVLSMLTKLRQLCCDPRLVYDNIQDPSIKIQAVMDIVEAAKESNKKVLIFSQFTSVFKLLRQEFAKEKISYFTLTGKTNKEERQRMVNEFNTDETNVFLISLKAGGTGLNLTGAEVVIHFDPWWNLSAQNQATDRAYRLGQVNNVQVYKLICKDTIEEKILSLQNLKKDLADSIIFENENAIAKMSIDDIMELF
ncbi:MAG: SNF2-related protein, partial [Erysipelotrichaceae bacterium]